MPFPFALELAVTHRPTRSLPRIALWRCLVICLFASADGAALAEDGLVSDGLPTVATDWPWWRGPNRTGEAIGHQNPPLKWNEKEGVKWKTPIPGRGHGSFCIVGEKVFVQTADETNGAQLVLCVDRSTGKSLWKRVVHASGGMRKNEKSTAASSTPACDGERLIVNFPNGGSLIVSALDLDGNPLWQTKVSDYVEHQGYGASPALYRGLAIVSSDNKGGGAIAALDRASGRIVWTHERPKLPNYPSPIVLHAAGKDQLVMTGCDRVTSLDPLTGDPLWEVDGATTECVTSTVTDGTRVFTSGGYPKNHLSAVMADGSGKLAWENDSRVYVPSLLIRQGTLFGVLDAGIAAAWRSDDGKELWKHRLGGTFSASPVLVGDNIYATNESGDTFIYRANATRFELIEKNHLGDEVLSTMVICDSHIYYRCAQHDEGKRQEYLYCLGQ